MIVTDSRTRDAVRPVFLTFAGRAADGEAVRPHGAERDVVGALRRAAEAAGVDIIAPDAVADFAVGRREWSATGSAAGRRSAARLLVAADGVRSRLRDLAGIGTVDWSYGQSGIVVTVAHERPHHGRAEEHFLPGGPFAILPLKPANRVVAGVDRARRTIAERLVARRPGRLPGSSSSGASAIGSARSRSSTSRAPFRSA